MAQVPAEKAQKRSHMGAAPAGTAGQAHGVAGTQASTLIQPMGEIF